MFAADADVDRPDRGAVAFVDPSRHRRTSRSSICRPPMRPCTGSASYPQAGVFVKNDLDESRVARFLSDLSASVASVNADPAAAARREPRSGFGFSEAVMTSAIPGSHLQYVAAAASRTALEAYVRHHPRDEPGADRRRAAG
ncbi:MAG: hypothetical protein MZU97_14410 [Bacillus subtilis]|nr:hypothetical protein [Bacillus subtilis]